MSNQTDWVRNKLEDLALVTVGHVGPMKNEYRASGIPFLRSQNILPHRLDLNDTKFIDDNFHTQLKKSALKPGDVVTVRTGKPGSTAVIPEDLAIANCSDLVIIRPGEQVDSHWLSYYINSTASGFISSQLVGAVQQHFNISSAKQMQLLTPPLHEQTAIATLLRTLDDKIAHNSMLVDSASELLRVAYKSMLDNSTAVPLSSTASFVNGKAFTKDASGSGRVVIRIAELNSGIGSATVYSDACVSSEHLATSGDILFAWSGSLTLHRWYRSDAIVNQHIFKVTPKTPYPRWLIYELIASKLQLFKNIAFDKATTMGHIQRKHLDEMVLVPSLEQIKRWDLTLSPLWQRMLIAEQESERLSDLRNALLPQLMSGSIRVREAKI